ncbi:MAG: insulinase family protein [Kiritimatiellae bacterium]|nr:insulinase family protein [Kiritimatiellia bacterium]
MLENIETSKLKNGLTVITYSRDDVESVSTTFYVKVGSRYESKNQSGISHFIEHMLFKGTKNRTARDIVNSIESHGGVMNAATSYSKTYFYTITPYDKFEYAIDILSDIYLNPLFKKEDVENEKNVILEEYNGDLDDPMSAAFDNSSCALWPNHPLGQKILGIPKTISSMTPELLAKYHKKHYIPANTVVVAVGRITHKQVVDELNKHFKGKKFSSNKQSEFKPVNESIKLQNLIAEARDVNQVSAVVSYRHNIGALDERFDSIGLLGYILGGNMSSRLFQEIREKKALCYSISSNPLFFAETGAMQIMVGLDKSKSLKGLQAIAKECKKLTKKKVSAEELQRAKDYLIGTTRTAYESTSSQMRWITSTLFRDKYRTPTERCEAIKNVTSDDILELARLIFKEENLSLSIIHPNKDFPDTPEAIIKAMQN